MVSCHECLPFNLSHWLARSRREQSQVARGCLQAVIHNNATVRNIVTGAIPVLFLACRDPRLDTLVASKCDHFLAVMVAVHMTVSVSEMVIFDIK